MSATTQPQASCPGAKSRIWPFKPHTECRPCARRHFVGVKVIAPIKPADLTCPNQVVDK